MYDPNKIYAKLIEIGEIWADKKAAFQLLDDMTKTILAERISSMEGGSMAERTEKARADKMYIAHLKGLGEARREYLVAEVKWKSVQMYADAKRTEQSTRRAEMKNISGT